MQRRPVPDTASAPQSLDLLADAVEETRAKDIRCLTCGYRLAGLPTHVCPECGHHFDPKIQSTISCEVGIAERKQFARSSAGALGIFFVLPLLLAWFTDMLYIDFAVLLSFFGALRLQRERCWWGTGLAILFSLYVLGNLWMFFLVDPLDPAAWTVRRLTLPAWLPLIGICWSFLNLWLWYRWYEARRAT